MSKKSYYDDTDMNIKLSRQSHYGHRNGQQMNNNTENRYAYQDGSSGHDSDSQNT
jgi:hypothetical protein